MHSARYHVRQSRRRRELEPVDLACGELKTGTCEPHRPATLAQRLGTVHLVVVHLVSNDPLHSLVRLLDMVQDFHNPCWKTLFPLRPCLECASARELPATSEQQAALRADRLVRSERVTGWNIQERRKLFARDRLLQRRTYGGFSEDSCEEGEDHRVVRMGSGRRVLARTAKRTGESMRQHHERELRREFEHEQKVGLSKDRRGSRRLEADRISVFYSAA